MIKQYWNTSRIVAELLRCGWRDFSLMRYDQGVPYRDRIVITANRNVLRQTHSRTFTFTHYVYDNPLY